MKKIIEILKSYWNIYGAPILATLIAWLNDFSRSAMDKTTSFIVLTLTFIGFLTFIKGVIGKKKEKQNIIEKASLSQSSIKAVSTAINPTKQGEELGETIIETAKLSRKVGKKMFKWIKKNKGAIISTLTIVIGILEFAFEFIYKYLPIELGFNIVGTLITLGGGLTATLTTGFGSTKFKEAIAQLKDQLNGDTTDLENITSIKYLERQIMAYEKKQLNIEKDIETLNKKYSSAINDFKTCQQLGLPIDEETNAVYQQYVVEFQKLQNELNSKTSALQTYKSKLEQVKSQLSQG